MMLAGNKLQDEVMAKEEAKIKMRREANEQRRLRIMDARARTMGLDIEALNAQVEEKNRAKRAGQENEELLRLQAIEIERIVAQAKEEEKQMLDFQAAELKKSWEESMKKKKELEAARRAIKDIDFDKCGSSSAVKFSGEDMTKYDRSKLQQNQMKRWTQEQMYERAYQKRIEKEEDMAYAEMIKAVDSIRENNENEEQELARYSRQATKEQNAELARIQRERQDQAKAERNDPLTKTSLDLFNEDTTTAMDSTGKVLRRDMFKGFTMEQRRKIQQENEDVLQEHRFTLYLKDNISFILLPLQYRMRKEKDLSEEYDWMLQQSMTLKAMEQV